jgi:glutaminyl-tRNA synthetase
MTVKCEPSLKDVKPEERYEFERLAYFALDKDSTPDKFVLNRTIMLKDTWAKEAQKSRRQLSGSHLFWRRERQRNSLLG